MTSSTLKTLGCLLLAFSACVVAGAQNQPPKKLSSISGKVTFKGTGMSGITVGAISQRSNMTVTRTRFGAVTDAQGNYRISDVTPGTYDLSPVAPQFVLAANTSKRVIVEEGETLEGIDFTLVRGGVISGKVTNSEGQPLIEEQVHLAGVEGEMASQSMMRLNTYFNQTDDRGMYRIFGLPPGKYTVSAGTPANRISFGSRNAVKYKQTFYPSVTDVSQATMIEVTEGSEATNINIVVTSREATYSVSGRIINGETGRPIPNARYGITKMEENGSTGMSGPVTNALGEFRIENLTPGKYMVTLERSMDDPLTDKAGNNLYADAARFEISDHDITDVIIKTVSGASVSGMVVFDGVDPKTALKKFGELLIMVNLPGNERIASGRNGPPARVRPDGSFTVSGLAAGEAYFMIFVQGGSENGRQIEVARVERDGVVLPRSLEIKEREQVTGVRVIVNDRTGVLQGIVKVENGQIDPTRMFVSFKRAGDSQGPGHSVPLDARGRFRTGGIAPGTYEIVANAYMPDSPAVSSTKQQIVISDDQVTEVTLTLDLKPKNAAGP